LSTLRSRRVLTRRPRASSLSTDSRYLVARLVACVCDGMGLGSQTVFFQRNVDSKPDRPFSHCPYLVMNSHNSHVVTHMEAGEIDFLLKIRSRLG
jgi:hypothetical protein